MLRKFSTHIVMAMFALAAPAFVAGTAIAKSPNGGSNSISPAGKSGGTLNLGGKINQISNQTLKPGVTPMVDKNKNGNGPKKDYIWHPYYPGSPWYDNGFCHHGCFDFYFDTCYCMPCIDTCYTPVVEVVEPCNTCNVCNSCDALYLVRVYEAGSWRVYHSCNSYDVAFGHLKTLKAKGLQVAIMKK